VSSIGCASQHRRIGAVPCLQPQRTRSPPASVQQSPLRKERRSLELAPVAAWPELDRAIPGAERGDLDSARAVSTRTRARPTSTPREELGDVPSDLAPGRRSSTLFVVEPCPRTQHTGRTSTIAIPRTLTTATDSFCSPVGLDALIHKGFSNQRTHHERLLPLPPARSG
jgi:hypothetical protein